MGRYWNFKTIIRKQEKRYLLNINQQNNERISAKAVQQQDNRKRNPQKRRESRAYCNRRIRKRYRDWETDRKSTL